MAELRKDIRVYPREFSNYRVRIDWEELTLEGFLGNISESGICVILNHDGLNEEVGTSITGAVLSNSLEEYLEFHGKIVWSRLEKHGKKTNFVIGIQFIEPIQLTGSLLLKSMIE